MKDECLIDFDSIVYHQRPHSRTLRIILCDSMVDIYTVHIYAIIIGNENEYVVIMIQDKILF
jgi:hypothetical protein